MFLDYTILANRRLAKEVKHYIERDDSTKLESLLVSNKELASEWDEFGEPFLATAAWMGSVKCVLILLKYGAKPNVLGAAMHADGTALHAAAFHATMVDDRGNRCLEIVRILLDAGINTELKNDWDETALDYVKNLQKRIQEEEDFDGGPDGDGEYDFERVFKLLRGKEHSSRVPRLSGMARGVLRTKRPEVYKSLPPHLSVTVEGYTF